MNKLQPRIRLHKQELIRKQSYWSEIIAEWQKNPISPSIWCKDKNVNKDHFYYWKRKLGTMQTFTAQKDSNFIEITTQQPISTDKRPLLVEPSKSLLEILLPSKINIRVTVPTMDIGQVIQQLSGGMAC